MKILICLLVRPTKEVYGKNKHWAHGNITSIQISLTENEHNYYKVLKTFLPLINKLIWLNIGYHNKYNYKQEEMKIIGMYLLNCKLFNKNIMSHNQWTTSVKT